MVSVQITTLSENSALAGFVAEWGQSIMVEADGLRVLLDTGGPGLSAISNAPLLGIDFSTIDRIVLSHGHLDHTGGLKEVLRRKGGEVEIIAHPAIWESKYVVRPNMRERYAGIPLVREELENLGARFNLTSEPVWITENIVTSGEVPLLTSYEEVDSDLYVKQDGQLRPDTVPDDLALAVKTELGLVIVLGCAHRGMVNTIRHLQKITSEELVHCVLGGTHLIRASQERLAQTVADLREIGIQRLGVSHCTGFTASAWLFQAFGDMFFMNNSGNRLTLP
jgi:7,8-dihydropterin-6-yl-methyl-4-(beta-D-ribofuranosyl)aminobenzene 5'-phosphate synthase